MGGVEEGGEARGGAECAVVALHIVAAQKAGNGVLGGTGYGYEAVVFSGSVTEAGYACSS